MPRSVLSSFSREELEAAYESLVREHSVVKAQLDGALDREARLRAALREIYGYVPTGFYLALYHRCEPKED